MAGMYPDPISADTKSIAKRMLYDCLQAQLDHSFVVLHSVARITHSAPSGAHDGEVDFLIAHPQYGVLVLEVKGGGIVLDGKSGYALPTSGRGG